MHLRETNRAKRLFLDVFLNMFLKTRQRSFGKASQSFSTLKSCSSSPDANHKTLQWTRQKKARVQSAVDRPSTIFPGPYLPSTTASISLQSSAGAPNASDSFRPGFARCKKNTHRTSMTPVVRQPTRLAVSPFVDAPSAPIG